MTRYVYDVGVLVKFFPVHVYLHPDSLRKNGGPPVAWCRLRRSAVVVLVAEAVVIVAVGGSWPVDHVT